MHRILEDTSADELMMPTTVASDQMEMNRQDEALRVAKQQAKVRSTPSGWVHLLRSDALIDFVDIDVTTSQHGRGGAYRYHRLNF